MNDCKDIFYPRPGKADVDRAWKALYKLDVSKNFV
jgi:hypothetical protein